MNLFNKEKDLIHRIANLIFILWVVIALFIAYTSFIDMVVKKDMLTYKEYEKQYCLNNVSTELDYPEKSSIAPSTDCKSAYERYKITFDDSDFYAKQALIHSLGNVIIVGVAIVLLNRKKA